MLCLFSCLSYFGKVNNENVIKIKRYGYGKKKIWLGQSSSRVRDVGKDKMQRDVEKMSKGTNSRSFFRAFAFLFSHSYYLEPGTGLKLWTEFRTVVDYE